MSDAIDNFAETVIARDKKPPFKGRGASWNPTGRFEKLAFEADVDLDDEPEDPDFPSKKPKTVVYKDTSRSILSMNDSPDLRGSVSLNAYRGCEHGCIYCYARPTHEYLGLSSGLDFETKIFAKSDAPELLRAALSAKSWKPTPIMMSGITDCYQPLERKLMLTRACLEVFAEFRNPVIIITKNQLVTRDIDVLKRLAMFDCVSVVLSVTTLNRDLARVLEPRTAQPELRLKAIRELSGAGIPVSVNMAPIIPGLTDYEIPAVLEAAAKAGARSAGYTVVRLPWQVKDLFVNWLEEHEPLKKEKVLNRIRDMRGGKLYKADFGSRMVGEGQFAEQIAKVFHHSRARYGLNNGFHSLSTRHFRVADTAQLDLF